MTWKKSSCSLGDPKSCFYFEPVVAWVQIVMDLWPALILRVLDLSICQSSVLVSLSLSLSLSSYPLAHMIQFCDLWLSLTGLKSRIERKRCLFFARKPITLLKKKKVKCVLITYQFATTAYFSFILLIAFWSLYQVSEKKCYAISTGETVLTGLS